MTTTDDESASALAPWPLPRLARAVHLAEERSTAVLAATCPAVAALAGQEHLDLRIVLELTGSAIGVQSALAQLDASGWRDLGVDRTPDPARTGSSAWVLPADPLQTRLIEEVLPGPRPAGVVVCCSLQVRGCDEGPLDHRVVDDLTTALAGGAAEPADARTGTRRTADSFAAGELEPPRDHEPTQTLAARGSSTRRVLLQGGALMAAATVGQAVGNLVFHAVASRAVGPSQYGALAALLAAMLALAVPLTSVQVATARAVAEADGRVDARGLVRRAERWALLIALISLPTAPWISGYLHIGSIPLAPTMAMAT